MCAVQLSWSAFGAKGAAGVDGGRAMWWTGSRWRESLGVRNVGERTAAAGSWCGDLVSIPVSCDGLAVALPATTTPPLLTNHMDAPSLKHLGAVCPAMSSCSNCSPHHCQCKRTRDSNQAHSMLHEQSLRHHSWLGKGSHDWIGICHAVQISVLCTFQ